MVQKILIDNSIYISEGLDFNSQSFLSLKKYLKQNFFELLISEDIKNEIMAKIKRTQQEFFSKLNKMGDNYEILKNNIKSLKQTEAEIKNLPQTVQNNIFKLGATDITQTTINIRQIMNDYFNENAPFKNGKKKHEFPDAIILHSLLKYLNEEKCVIISGDSDWKNFCNIHKNQLEFYDKISSFLNNYLYSDSFYDSIRDKLWDYLNNDINFKQNIKDLFQEQFFYHDESIIAEPEIEFNEIQSITLLNKPEIIDFEKVQKIIKANISVNIAFEVTISGYDASSWHKDYDTKEVFYINGIDNDEITTEEIANKEIGLIIQFDDEYSFEIIDIKMDDNAVEVGYSEY